MRDAEKSASASATSLPACAASSAGGTPGSASTPGQRRISPTDSGTAPGALLATSAAACASCRDAREIHGEAGGAGRRTAERDAALDLAALQLGEDPLAQRRFEAAQLVGEPKLEVEITDG